MAQRAPGVLARADMYAAAQVACAPWTLLLDEFGGVMNIAANRTLAMLQRGRSHRGQVMIVVTQSAADPEALTGQAGLLASLTDNFTGFAIHRQNAPETRDWLAKLMGTTAIWQSTDQTTAHGAVHSGKGSRRRVRQFRVGADTFAELGRGQAITYSTLGGQPQRTHVLRARFPHAEPDRIGTAERHACEIEVHPTSTLDQLVADVPAMTEEPRRSRGRPKVDPEPTQLSFEAEGV